ncbi:MAG: hypothetical protein A4E19_17680 [Nitrospira sp. SG-bin1]|nr:MAG: hypothetical protein A4E19_17680 [Nitrospira sp. SG-bin1]
MADAFHGRLQAPITGDDNDLHVRAVTFYFSEEIESVAIRKLLIKGDEVNGCLAEDVEGGLGVFCRANIAEGAKYHFKGIAGPRFIINNEDCRLYLCRARSRDHTRERTPIRSGSKQFSFLFDRLPMFVNIKWCLESRQLYVVYYGDIGQIPTIDGEENK